LSEVAATATSGNSSFELLAQTILLVTGLIARRQVVKKERRRRRRKGATTRSYRQRGHTDDSGPGLKAHDMLAMRYGPTVEWSEGLCPSVLFIPLCP